MKLLTIGFAVGFLLIYGSAFASGIVIIEAKGTCKDGTQVTEQGNGADPAKATTKANKLIVVECASKGGVKSYDSAVIIRDTRTSKSKSSKSTVQLAADKTDQGGVHVP